VADTGSLREAVERQRSRAADALVDDSLHATVTADDRSAFAEFADLAELGVTSVKFFTAYDTGRVEETRARGDRVAADGEVVGFDDDRLQAAFAETDHLILACPFTDLTERLVDEGVFRTLPTEATLVKLLGYRRRRVRPRCRHRHLGTVGPR